MKIFTLIPLILLSKQEAEFNVEVILQAPETLPGCVIDDIDPDRAGIEIAATCSNGDVYLIYKDKDGWKNEVIYHSPGELVLCASGKILPDKEGMQLACAGMAKGEESDKEPGQVAIIWKENGKWKGEKIFEDKKLLHGITVADVDPDTEGDEIIAGGYTNKVYLIRRNKGSWDVDTICTNSTPVKDIIVTPSLTSGQKRLVFVNSKGEIQECTIADEPRTCTTLYSSTGGLNRIGQYITGFKTIIAASGNSGDLIVITDDGTDTKTETIYKTEAKLRGAAINDYITKFSGPEIAVGDYDGNILVFYRESGKWKHTTVYKDKEYFHHITSGRIYFDSLPSFAACGGSGRLLLFTSKE